MTDRAWQRRMVTLLLVSGLVLFVVWFAWRLSLGTDDLYKYALGGLLGAILAMVKD